MVDDDAAWFEAKRYGYGAGVPIRWQGWVSLGVFVVLLAGVGVAGLDFTTTLAIVVPAAISFAILAAFKTRGGWRWRGGED